MKRDGGRLGITIAMLALIGVGGYFLFAAIQGEYGVFRRIEVEARIATLAAERDGLAAEVAALRARTRALSADSLDLDLLDEQARRVLGFARADEVVIR